MYVIKRTSEDTISYYKYDGWESFPKEGPLDLSNCVLFTYGEASKAAVSGEFKGCQFQWYGSYKR
jgi:hypothetical protein